MACAEGSFLHIETFLRCTENHSKKKIKNIQAKTDKYLLSFNFDTFFMADFFFHLKINEKTLPFQKVSDTRLQRHLYRERKKNTLSVRFLLLQMFSTLICIMIIVIEPFELN